MEGPSSSSPSGDRVRLNVGGKIFETTISTLTKIQGTVLSTIVAERWRGEGELFIDRDPTHFSKILNYLRDGDEFSAPLDRDACEELRREAQFMDNQEGSIGQRQFRAIERAAAVEPLTSALNQARQLFYNLIGLAELCSPQVLNVGDEVQWKREAVGLYWRPFVRYMVDDSLTLPFIYDRNNHTLAKCIGCEEYQDPKCSYLFDIRYEDWEPMKHHMLLMRGEITQLMGEQCCIISWDNGQQIHLPRSAHETKTRRIGVITESLIRAQQIMYFIPCCINRRYEKINKCPRMWEMWRKD
ncbi:hypothetical protein RB195_018189 [Necator americanus]|uniref:Potassium channel tetramerisation-type BTB domain-containing protein n=1 Tax=Necator americanus TaxID=51031 RepID=A0ABR1CBI7_NECAM